MRNFLVVVALGAALVLPALVGAGPASAASFKACSGSYAPDGTPGGGFYSRIKAKRITCTTARTVTRAWVKAMASGSTNPTTKVKVQGYSCKRKAVSSPGDPNGGLSVLCTNGTKAVSFYGHP
ncbi:MAG: hypothetical protein JWO02_2769 [Solirubrobacterales bacterium]|nr:hypothetical protein [Solirubrobacterales bacterium]